MELQSEPFKLGNTDEAKVRLTLMRHGASKGEIDMLLAQQRRVELNAMSQTSSSKRGPPPDGVRRQEGDPGRRDDGGRLAPNPCSTATEG